MPTLLLTPRQTEDAQALWRGTVSLGWHVHRVHDWKVPEVNAADAAVYAEPLLAMHIAQMLGLELLGPADAWLSAIPECWRKRPVLFTTMKEARECAEPRFIKSAAGKEFDARIYESGKDLPHGQMINDSLPVLVQEIVRWDVEYRCFVSERQVKAASSYWRHGKYPCNEYGIWSQNELSDAMEFCRSFLSDPNVSLPDASLTWG